MISYSDNIVFLIAKAHQRAQSALKGHLQVFGLTPMQCLFMESLWEEDGLSVGDMVLKERWKWNLNLGYRKVGSDALVDGFVDSDFGGGGTNVKGFTFGGNLALSPNVKFGLRWMSASQVGGPTFKNDILQLDFSGKF